MEKITVSIRVRPLNKQEAPKGSPWRVSANAISLCNATTGALLSGQAYVFDSVFGTDSKTLDLYEAHTKAVIASAVKGINGTVFAYGQTSSGKTFTMRGNSEERGIIPLAVQDVFHYIQQAEDREFLLRVSYMEIYNEEINDLLEPDNRKLQVHENVERGIFVAGLREEIVCSPEQVIQLMEFGESHRHVGETNMNVYSSRSHTIFRMVIESRDRSQDDLNSLQACDAVRVSSLTLVDLAGSERAAKTGAEGARLKEGSYINKSLMTLGTVINKLSEGIESQGGHVPYRDSKLTRILQPALGGNARTVIICNVTPALVHVDETKGTLQFASRAIRVTNCAQVNEIVTDAALLKRQKKEIEELRGKLQEAHSDHLEEEIMNLRNAMLKIELERERMASELQDKAARERRMKEQIENLSTLVLNSAVDDRHTDKSSKKSNRRETWCPRLTSSKPVLEIEKFSAQLLPEKLPRNFPLPPPFEKLVEEMPLKESEDELTYLSDQKRRKSTERSLEKEELLDLQSRYDDLHSVHQLAVAEIEQLRMENEALKLTKRGDRRCRSLDGSQDDASAAATKLQEQIQNLEVEKRYMQRELDNRIEHAKEQASSAKQVLEELYGELKESNQQLESFSARNTLLEQEKEQLGKELEETKIKLEEAEIACRNKIDESQNCPQPSELSSQEDLAKIKEELALELTEVCFQLEEERALAASRTSALEAKLSCMEDENGTMLKDVESKLSEAEGKLQASMQEKHSLEEILEKLTQELTDVHFQLQEEQALSTSRQQSLEGAQARLSALEEQFDMEKEGLSGIGRKMDIMRTELAEADDKLKAAAKEKVTLEEINEALTRELEDTRNRHEEERTLLASKLSSLESMYSALREEYDKNIEGLQKDVSIMHKELEATLQDKSLHEEMLKKLTGELKHTRWQLEEETKLSASRQTSLDETKAALYVLKQELDKGAEVEETEILRTKLVETECVKGALEKASADMEKRLTEELRDVHHLLKEERRSRQCSVEEALKKIQNIEEENKRLLTSRTKLQVAFDAMSARAEVFEMRLEDARWDLIEARDKAFRTREEIEASLGNARQEIVELKLQLESAKVVASSSDPIKQGDFHGRMSFLKKKLDNEQEGRGKETPDIRLPLTPIGNYLRSTGVSKSLYSAKQ